MNAKDLDGDLLDIYNTLKLLGWVPNPDYSYEVEAFTLDDSAHNEKAWIILDAGKIPWIKLEDMTYDLYQYQVKPKCLILVLNTGLNEYWNQPDLVFPLTIKGAMRAHVKFQELLARDLKA